MSTPHQPQSSTITNWILIPLRLFLGITFTYAGLQKLTDPQFFQPSAHGYVGKQITAFAIGSPLHNFLLQVVAPHASFFGALVAYGELAIGIGTILGLLLRPAAFFGLLLSLTFFLSATWRVYPYFYGSDIVFVFCWLTLLLAGPANTGLPTIDALLTERLLSAKQQARFAPLLSFFLGIRGPSTSADTPITQNQNKQVPGNKRSAQTSKYVLAQRSRDARRNFLLGTLTGTASMLGLAWLWNTLHSGPQSAVTPGTGATTPASAGTLTSSGTGTSAPSGTVIAQANAVQNNSAVSFTIPSNDDPGVLVRLENGQFVAYDAICTHAGCPVDYDPTTHLLVCPCHGATFDPAKSAAVVAGPANTPLTKVPVHVDSITGTITVVNS